MRTCEYCHIELPGDAAFCGSCGRVQSAKLPSAHSSSSSNDFATALMFSQEEEPVTPPGSEAHTILSALPVDTDPLAGRNLRNMNHPTSSPSHAAIADMPTLHGVPADQEEEDEEKRPIPLFSRIFPAAAGVELFDTQNDVGQAPTLQGAPDPGSAAVYSGTPQADAAQTASSYSSSAPNQQFDPQAQYAPFQQAAPSFPPVHTPYTPPSFPPHVDLPFPPINTPYTPPAGSYGSPPPFPGQPSPQAPHAGRLPKGCALWGAILIIPVLILLSVFGLGLTVFAPQLSLSGTTSVNPGDALHVHGHSFLANTTISLTIDDNQSIQFASQPSTPQVFSASSLHTQALLLSTLASTQPMANTVKTSSKGTFDATIMVNNNWSPGRHILHAREGLTPRSATLAFTVLPQSDTLPPAETVTPTQHATPVPPSKPTATSVTTPTANPTQAPTPVVPIAPTAIPIPTATPTPTILSQLSSVNPNALAMGNLAQNSTQPLSSQTTLSASGNALVSWNATWSQQASWLQVSPSSGQISTPGSQQIVVTANAGNLQPGTYSTTISFSSPSNAQPLTLNVSFKVLAPPCLTAKPASLTFTGTVGGPDPANQQFSLSNCGASGSWTETASTTDGANWLQASPPSGTLASGATQTITVGTAITSTQLAAGTYKGSIVFSTGNTQTTVTVNLTVQAVIIQSPAKLQVTPTSLNMATSCATLTATTFVCQVTLTALNATQAITWTATSDYRLTRFNATTGSIATGQSVTVTFSLARVVCPGSTVTVTFTGPNNAVPVTISC